MATEHSDTTPLVKLELHDDNGLVGFAVVTPQLAVGFDCRSSKRVDFDEVPARAAALQNMLRSELASLQLGEVANGRDHPELTHVVARTFGHLRLQPRVRNVRVLTQRPSRHVLISRHLEPWVATTNPAKLEEGEELNVGAFNYMRTHVNGQWARIRRAQDGEHWAFWAGPAGRNGNDQGAVDSMFDAQERADAAAHPGCDGQGCGHWFPGGVFEWRG